MKKPLFAASMFFIGLSFGPVCDAQSTTYVLNSEKSSLQFQADTPLHAFSGTTHELSGSITADPAAGQWQGVSVVKIQTDAFQTGNEARDHAVAFTLGGKKNAPAEFTIQSVTVLGEDASTSRKRCRVLGELKIGQQSHPLDFEVLADFEEQSASFSGELVLKILDYKLAFPPLARFIKVKDAVHIKLDVVWDVSE